jgi:hypothetical protein
MNPTPIIEVFGNGLFGTNDPPTNNRQSEQMEASRFNSVILWSVHVHPNGDLYYNETPLVTGGTFNLDLNFMQPYVAALKAKGEVWWGVGAYGVDDFSNIGKLLATPGGTQILQSNFGALLKTLPADGIDLDMEESYDQTMRHTIVQFSLFLNNQLNTGITYCPYIDEDFWLNCLADVYEQNGNRQIIRRFNLQCYAGGGGNSTKQWLSDLRSFGRPLGIVDVSSFIVPSYWVRSDDSSEKNSPSDICAFFSNPDIRENAGGGFLWNTSEIFESGFTAADYSEAVMNGLANEPTIDTTLLELDGTTFKDRSHAAAAKRAVYYMSLWKKRKDEASSSGNVTKKEQISGTVSADGIPNGSINRVDYFANNGTAPGYSLQGGTQGPGSEGWIMHSIGPGDSSRLRFDFVFNDGSAPFTAIFVVMRGAPDNGKNSYACLREQRCAEQGGENCDEVDIVEYYGYPPQPRSEWTIYQSGNTSGNVGHDGYSQAAGSADAGHAQYDYSLYLEKGNYIALSSNGPAGYSIVLERHVSQGYVPNNAMFFYAGIWDCSGSDPGHTWCNDGQSGDSGDTWMAISAIGYRTTN